MPLLRRLIQWFWWILAAACVVVPAVLFVRFQQAATRSRKAFLHAVELVDDVHLPALDADTERLERARVALEHAADLTRDDNTRRLARSLSHAVQGEIDLAHGFDVLAEQDASVAEGFMHAEPHARLLRARIALYRSEAPRAIQLASELLVEKRGYGVPSVSIALRARVLCLLAETYLTQGQSHEALTAAEQLDHERPDLGRVKNVLGRARAAVGDLQGAHEAFTAAAALSPADPTPWVHLAALARDAGELQQSKALLERALLTQSNSASSWLAYANVLVALHAPSAFDALDRAMKLDERDPMPWIVRGQARLDAGQMVAAAEDFRAALVRDAENPTALTALGDVHMQLGLRVEAAVFFERAVRVAPHLGIAWNGLGRVQLALGRKELAVGSLRQAMGLLPDDPEPAYHLGLACEAIQAWNDAGRAYVEALRRKPTHRAAFDRLIVITPVPDRPREIRRWGGALAIR